MAYETTPARGYTPWRASVILQPPQNLTAHGALGLDGAEFASGRSEVGWPSLSGRRFNVATIDYVSSREHLCS